MKGIIILPLFVILLLASLSCAAKEVTKNLAPAPELALAPGTGQSQKWEQEWEKAISGGRREGKVVVYLFAGIANSLRDELSKEMKSKYGLELEMLAGRSNELAEKVIREQRAGLYLADLYLAGLSAASAIIKPAGILEPLKPLLVLPEVKDPNLWWGGELPFADKEKNFIIAPMAYPSSGVDFNADYASKEELQSYRDLLNPKWKGKIVLSDPTIGGSGQSWFSAIGVKTMGMDYLKQLASQDIAITRDLRLMAEWMARGKYPLGLGASTGILAEMQRAGVPFQGHIPKEGAILAAGGNNLALFNKAPHPNATKVFVNWLLSKEGMTIYSRGQDTQSARVDIPTDFLTTSGIRKAGVNYIDTRNEESWIQMGKDGQIARDIFNIR